MHKGAFARLTLVSILVFCVLSPAHAQSCTAPTIVQVAGGYCAGEAITLDAGTGWATYLWSNGQTGRYLNDTPLVDTTYTVTVTDGSGCQVTSAPFVHSVSGTTTAPAISAPATICTGAQGTATAQYPPDLEPSGMNRMEWTISGGHFYDPVGTNPTTASGESVVFVATGPSPVTLSATAFAMGNCSTATATVAVTLGGQTPVILSPSKVCPNGSATAAVAPPSGGGSWSYVSWQVINGNFGRDYQGNPITSISGESTVFYGDGSNNPIELRVRVVDSQSCETESATTVVMRTIAPPVINAPSEVCPNGSATASVAPPAEGGSWNYVSWQITNGHFGWDPYTGGPRTTMSGESAVFYGDGSGNPIELRVRAIDPEYCEAESTATVAMRAIAPPVINAPAEVCPNGSATASVAPPAEGGSWNYVSWQITNGHFGWDPYTGGPRTSMSGESAVFYGDGSGSPIQLRVRTIDFQYCEAESTATVAMRAIAPPVISAPSAICPNGSATASVAPPAEGGAWNYVSWQITNGHFGWDPYSGGQRTSWSGESAVFYGDGSGLPIELRVRAIDFQYCESASATTVAMRTIAAPVISAPTEMCPNGSATASVAPPAEGGAWNYVSWQITNGHFGWDPYSGGQRTSTSGEAPVFYADGSGLPVELRARTIDFQYCEAESTKSVAVVPVQPDIQVTPQPVPLEGPATASVAGSFTYYSWQIERGTFVGGTSSSSVTFQADGTGPVKLRVTVDDGMGCSGTHEELFFLEGQPLSIDGPASFCSTAAPKTATLSTQGTAESIVWTVLNGTINAGQGTTEISFTPSSLADVTLTVSATISGTTTSESKVVPYLPPVLEVYTGDDIACAMRRTQVEWRNSADFPSFTASVQNGVLSGFPPLFEVQANNDTDDVTMTITGVTADGCSTTWTHTFQHAHVPELTYSPASLCSDGTQAATLVNASSDYLSFAWMGIENGVWITPPPASGAHPATMTYRATGTSPVVLILRVQPRDLSCASDRRFTLPVEQAPARPTITASGTSFCPGGSVTLTASAGTSYLWSNGATTQSIAVTQAGDYTVTVTNGAGCAATSAPTTVTADAPFTADIDSSIPTTNLCESTPVTLTALPAGASYLWSNGATTQSITVSTGGTYSVTVTNANGCSDSESRTLSYQAAAKPTITADGPLQFCDRITLTANLGENVASWQWQMVNSADYGSRIGNTYTTSFSGTIQVMVQYTNGCVVFSDPVTFTKLEGPSDVTIAGTEQICPGGTRTLRAVGGDATTTFVWSTGATGREITISEAGTYSVTATGGPNNCSVVRSTTVGAYVRGPVEVTASGPTRFCAGGSVTLTANETNPQSYLWSNGATTPSITVTESGSYFVTVVDELGCSISSNPISVTVDPAPTVDIIAGQVYDSPGSGTIVSNDGDTVEVCGDPTIRLRASVLNPAHTYVWSTGATGAFLDVRESGTYTLTMTDVAGCTATSSITVHYNAPPATPVVTASGPTTFCEGGSVTLTAPGGYSYLWSNGATTQSITVSEPGSFQVTVSNAMGCSATSAATSVAVNAPPPTPTVTANGPTSFCEGSYVILSAPAGYTYSWSNGTTNQSLAVFASGSYSVTVTDANGCSATSAATDVIVNAKPATPVITASGPTTFCEGGAVTLTAPAAFSHLWSNGATTQSITVSASGSYSVTVASASGCSATSAATDVIVNPPPATPVITAGGPTTFCEGGSVTLTAPAGYSYLWSNGATTQSIGVSASGAYSVTVANANGCSATSAPATVTVTAPPAAPVITASGPTTFCEGGSVTLTAPAGYSYLWSNGATTQSIGVSASGAYSVTVTNANGCSATSAATSVTVNPAPATPVIAASGSTALCPGASVTLTAPAGYSYLWSNGANTQAITVSAAGSYSVTVTNANGCSSTSAATVVTANAPTVITTQPASQTMPRSSTRQLSVTASGTAPLMYQWYQGSSGDTSTPLAGKTASTLTIGPYTKKGTYRYWVRVWSGTCTASAVNSTTATINVTN
jgi:hypothetical protein